MPWRVYRPAIVVGDSQTGAMDKVDGPYYFFPTMKLLRDRLPAWLPLVGVDLGDTNVVPVDYVAKAMDHLAHLPDRDGEAFHLVNPEPQPVVEMINAFCAAAGRPAVRDPDRPQRDHAPARSRCSRGGCGRCRSLNGVVAVGAGPGRARPDHRPARRPGRGARAHQLHRRLRLPRAPRRRWPARHRAYPTSSPTPRTLWAYWEEQPRHLDRPRPARPARRSPGKYVVITGASSGIGQVTALKVAQAGGVPVLVARGKDKLEETQATIEMRGGHGARLPVRPVRPRGDRPALRADHRPSCRRSTSSSTTPAARSGGR